MGDMRHWASWLEVPSPHFFPYPSWLYSLICVERSLGMEWLVFILFYFFVELQMGELGVHGCMGAAEDQALDREAGWKPLPAMLFMMAHEWVTVRHSECGCGHCAEGGTQSPVPQELPSHFHVPVPVSSL